MKPVPFLFAAAFVLGCTAGRAADFKKVGPLAPSASLIAARGRVQEPGIEFVYRIEGGAPPPATVTFDLAQDFSVADAGDVLTIYDYALKRVIVLNDRAHRFGNNSLYGLVDSRAGTAPGMNATFTPSKQAMNAQEVARLAKLLRAITPLSAGAVALIQASGFLPQTMSFGSGTANLTWTLQSAVAVTSVYPLMASARPPQVDPQDLSKAFGDALPVMVAALAGQAPGKRTPQDLRASIEKALDERHPFQAALLALELKEQFGADAGGCSDTKPCRPPKSVFAAAAKDPRMKALTAAMHPSKARLASAIHALETMKRDDLGNAYMLDAYLADDLAAAGNRAEALPHALAALKGNPYIPAFYGRLGDIYRAGLDPVHAWASYDLGRALASGANAPGISTVTDHEAELEKKYPEFF